MYTLFIALGIGVSLSVLWAVVLFPGAYIVGPILGMVAFLIAFALLSRRLMKQIQPKLMEAQKLAQSNQIKKAVETLEELRPFSKWQLLLEGQVNAQIGMFAYHEDEDRAYDFLLKASPRAPDAFLLRAAIEYRRGDNDTAVASCEAGIRSNKKHAMLYNMLAWLHQQEDDNDSALKVLNRYLAIEKTNDATRSNAERLQNAQKLDMRQFGDMWYLLKIDRPPAQMGMMTGRKGFRQPKGANKKPKRKKR